VRRLREALALTSWDLALTLGVIAWALAEAIWLSGPVPTGSRATFALAVTLPLAWRNRAPLAVLAFAAAGWAVAQRRAEAAQRRRALSAAEASADARVRAGTERERLRLAGELRTLIAATLAAMAERLERGGQGATLARSAEEVQELAAEAMAELRQLLGVLHEREEIVELATIGSSVEAARERGWQLAFDGAAAPRVTPGAELAAGRLVDELLTGPGPAGARATVRMVPREGGLRLRISGRGAVPTVLDDPAARRSLEERARLHGGRLGVLRLGRRWRVRAELPGVGTPEAAPRWPATLVGDLVVVAGAALVVLGDALAAPRPWTMAAVGAAWFVLPLALRRRAPLLVPFAIGSGLVLCEVAGLYGAPSPGPLVLALLAVGSIAMRAPSRPQAIGEVTLVLVPAVAVNWVQQAPGEPPTDTPIILFLAAMAYAFGRLVREQQLRAADAASGWERVEAEVDQRVAAALDAERRAVARDLHDVVAHSVSLASVLAGAVAAQAPRDPVAAQRSLESAREVVRQAQAELERLTLALAIGGAPALAAAPIGDLGAVIADARAGGQAVSATIDAAAAAGLPPVVAATAYRVVQEALTNARKHAPGSPVEVVVAVAAPGLELRVRNAPPHPMVGAVGSAGAPIGGAGRGLAGMAERVRLLGGELVAGPDDDGGFTVRGRVPISPGGGVQGGSPAVA
jgi:signal transduction histidine kinase